MSRRILTAFFAALFTSVALVATAQADNRGSGSTGATVDTGGVTVHANAAGNTSQAAEGGGSSLCPAAGDPEFIWACGGPPVCPDGPAVLSAPGVSSTQAISGGSAPRITCGTLPPSSATPPSGATPAQLAQQAASRLSFALPSASMAPPSSSLVVNFPTWLWIDPSQWHSLSATATAGGVVATATAAPARVVWNMGDGGSVICFGPGIQWTPAQGSASSNCQYAYTNNSYAQPSGVYNVTSTIYWHVTWVANGAAGGGDFGLVAGPSATTPVHVGEIHAVNVASGG